MKEIKFSNLPLDLKKQFIYFLAKNNVDFKQLKNSRFLHTKIKLISKKGNAQILIKNKDFSELAQKKSEPSKYHKDCTKASWHNKKIISSPTKQILDKETNDKRLADNLTTFAEMRVLLREHPAKKKHLEKYHEMIVRDKEFRPNKGIEKPAGKEIYYENDYDDKDYYYRNIAKRLGYSREFVHLSNIFISRKFSY